MAERRKVGKLLALAVLSTVSQRPIHPYEIASVLRSRGKDKDIPFKWGSLYTVVRNLAKHGFWIGNRDSSPVPCLSSACWRRMR